MKKLLAGIFVALSMLAGMAAHAATPNIVGSQAIVFDDNTSDLGAKFGASANHLAQTFSESFTFTSSGRFDVSTAVISIALNTKSLDISSVTLFGGSQPLTATKTVTGNTQYFELNAGNLPAGSYTLTVLGTVSKNGGSFGGNISISAVPEASTTAMMLGGLVIVGLAALRRSRKQGFHGRVAMV